MKQAVESIGTLHSPARGLPPPCQLRLHRAFFLTFGPTHSVTEASGSGRAPEVPRQPEDCNQGREGREGGAQWWREEGELGSGHFMSR